MKKLIAKILIATISVLPLAVSLPLPAGAIVTPNWDTTGNYVINMNYLGTDYPHDMHLIQDNAGNLTGNGGSPAGANVYMWTIDSGMVSLDSINFTAHYTTPTDATSPLTTLTVMGTIANDGSMSGTWSDNYQGGNRTGTWMTTSGHAAMINEDDQDNDNEDNPTTTVTIVKYIDGVKATSTTANGMSFPMTASWDAQNIGQGSGQFSLSPNGFNGDPTPYQAITSEMTKGASYTTSEMTGGQTVGASCQSGQPFALMGYSVGNSIHQAQHATMTTTAPNLTNIRSHRKFIIVWNESCDGSNGGGGGGGGGGENNGILHVDSIDVVKGTATPNGTFADGWKYVFHITDPTNEPNLAMKFTDWTSGSNFIPVANNMRISSLQADNGGASILITASNTYSTPFHMITDLNSGMVGRQVDVTVEVAVPSGTGLGSYTTTYGIKSTP